MPRFDPHPQRRPVVVTGASSGIGEATARALAGHGHPVALGARRVEVCEQVAESIRAGGGEAIALKLDVAETDSVNGFVAEATNALGPIEIAVSGAGELDTGLIHEQDPEAFLRQIDVHLAGAHRLVAEVVPGMIERQRGDVVIIGSDVVPAPRPRVGGYVPAKSGLEAMARTMQKELEGTGVRASIVRPGPTSTGMGMDWDAHEAEAVLQDWVHWGFARHSYFLRPGDIADAVTTAISVPRGVHLTLLEVEPEAPLREST
ncbi:SDR family oxidoreductase [Haloechinothrix sp. LS1_15]|uniref:SDR family oxidoreductase n=1 Tax=Haloechinothrix sp. LS1_15 TaxID=2652248 RepID=UPI00294717F6|nr:SDR family oxidoreductase [Haloechinothrix sp. LS1_15]MDV6014109.1 SDR family oxidoreductase [Haloechinothrix sp. LS1_15]